MFFLLFQESCFILSFFSRLKVLLNTLTPDNEKYEKLVAGLEKIRQIDNTLDKIGSKKIE